MKYKITMFYIFLFLSITLNGQTLKKDTIIINDDFEFKEIIFDRNEERKRIGNKFNDLKVYDLDNNEVILNNNEVVLYVFWKGTCSACLEEIPLLVKLKNENKNNVRFVAISNDEIDEIKSNIKKHHFTFEHFHIKTEDIFKVSSGFPTILIVNEKVIIHAHKGGPPRKGEKYHELYKKYLFESLSDVFKSFKN